MRYSAKFVKGLFKVLNMKKIVGISMIDPPKRRNIIAKQLKRIDIPQKVQSLDGHQLITLLPAHPTKRHVFYLHGGGYALEASPFHKNLQERFVKRYNLKVSYFDYPLAPENTAEKTLPLTEKAFRHLNFLYPDDKFYLFGDSAGGGLAMSLAQLLRDIDLEQRPEKIALVSPWLDATVSDPRSNELQEKDVLLEKDLLTEAGENYAGTWAVTDPRVSPIYGNFDDLGRLFVIAGTDEILYPDVLRLQERIKRSENTEMTLTVVPDMMHDFVVYPLKESLTYIDQIGEFFSEKQEK
ncbi:MULTISPECIES: alpha/beta hydrolase fold domain-containing protein [Enterococcus]|uniref:Alpha/beta hydrolase n=1 Tax=Enterococcus alishanensis TaxID=1303817 RepID=A0ABS6TFU7_9ENTE|nr:alpha/beta hydrolase [Enterococcus alishanensis]MBV7391803.1 alpha/beta hydrolase [Enterococcus alishanensis]